MVPKSIWTELVFCVPVLNWIMVEVKTGYQFLSKHYLTKYFCNSGFSVCMYYYPHRRKNQTNPTKPKPIPLQNKSITYKIPFCFESVQGSCICELLWVWTSTQFTSWRVLLWEIVSSSPKRKPWLTVRHTFWIVSNSMKIQHNGDQKSMSRWNKCIWI